MPSPMTAALHYRFLNPTAGASVQTCHIQGAKARQLVLSWLPASHPLHQRGFTDGALQFATLKAGDVALDQALFCSPSAEVVQLFLHASRPLQTAFESVLAGAGAQPLAYVSTGLGADADHESALLQCRSRHSARVIANQSDQRLCAALAEWINSNNQSALRDFVDHTRYALLALRPIQVFLTGPSNSGKSTLFNLFADKDLSIVSDVLYTTRDTLAHSVVWDGLEWVIHDTPGSGEFADGGQDLASYEHAEGLFSRADVVLQFTPLDVTESEQAAGAQGSEINKGLRVFSKADLALDEWQARRGEADLWFSAHSGEGVDHLRRKMFKQVYAGTIPQPADVVGYSEAHVGLGEDILQALECGETADALARLQRYEETL